MIYSNVTELIGRTPLLSLENFSREYNIKKPLLAKLEYFNPAGSAKDRVALYMIEAAEKEGKLKPGTVVIEPTSGNTGIGLAAVCAQRSYKIILTMPETMSVERRKLLKAYGAEIVLTDGNKGMSGAIEKAEELANQFESSFIPGQFVNMANPQAHRETTGVEIWEDTKGDVDVFIAGVGTGGTITGVGEYLKGKNPNIKIIAVEPYDSPLLSEGRFGSHGLQGIGANFVPEILNTKIYDEVITVKTEDAYAAGRTMAHSEGVLVGISAGAALHAAALLSSKKDFTDKSIVILLPDTGERYLSTTMFDKSDRSHVVL